VGGRAGQPFDGTGAHNDGLCTRVATHSVVAVEHTPPACAGPDDRSHLHQHRFGVADAGTLCMMGPRLALATGIVAPTAGSAQHNTAHSAPLGSITELLCLSRCLHRLLTQVHDALARLSKACARHRDCLLQWYGC
jgi:hypothetical protein